MRYLLRWFGPLFLAVSVLAQTTPVTQVDNWAALKALPISAAGARMSVLMKGRLTANDGGGGVFYSIPGSVAGDDGGIVATFNTGGGAWFRQYTGPLNLVWFGVLTNGTDQLSIVQGVVDHAVTGNGQDTPMGCTVIFPPGIIGLNGTLNLHPGNTLIGAGPTVNGTVIKQLKMTGDTFSFVSSQAPALATIHVYGLLFSTSGANTSGAAIRCTVVTPLSQIITPEIEKCTIEGFFRGIEMDNVVNARVVNVIARDIVETAFKMNTPCNDSTFENCYAKGGNPFSKVGFNITGNSISLISCASDNLSDGILLTNVSNSSLVACSTEGWTNRGITMVNVKNSSIKNAYVHGTTLSLHKDGIKMDGGYQNSIEDSQIVAGTPSGAWGIYLTNDAFAGFSYHGIDPVGWDAGNFTSGTGVTNVNVYDDLNGRVALGTVTPGAERLTVVGNERLTGLLNGQTITTNSIITGKLTIGNNNMSANGFQTQGGAGAQGMFFYSAANGASIMGETGATYDLSLQNTGGTPFLGEVTGTQTTEFGGNIRPGVDNTYTSGEAGKRWADVKTVLINGAAPALGTVTGTGTTGVIPVWSSSTALDGTGPLMRFDANSLWQRNGVNNQNIFVSGTYTDDNTYQRLRVGFATGTAYIQAEGSSTSPNLTIGTSGSTAGLLTFRTGNGQARWNMAAADGSLVPNSDGVQYLGDSTHRVKYGWLGGSTETTSNPILTLNQTWNNAGVTFTGGLINITDTASASASLFVDCQIANVSKASLRKDGAFGTLGGISIGSLTYPSAGTATALHDFRAGDNIVVGNAIIFGSGSGNSSIIQATANGNFFLQNFAGTDMGRIQGGGTTASYPGLGRSTVYWTQTLADGTAGGGLKLSGSLAAVNNVNTVGSLGVPAIYGTGRSTAQTGAVASLATYTVGAADGSFLVSGNVNVTTSSAENFTIRVVYTDETNTSRTQTMPLVLLAGTFVGVVNFANGAVPYEGTPLHIRAKASTSITVSTTGTFTGATYNAEGNIYQTN